MLEAKQLSYSVAGATLVREISLTLEAGDTLGLIGPNGAGKTSLLRLLAGLRRPSHGEVCLTANGDQWNLQRLPARQRARLLGYLGQQETPAWPLSVENLVGLGRAPWRGPGAHTQEDLDAIERALTQADLLELRQRPVSQLSGGELQRALLGRVLAARTPIILADEPIASLDPYHQLHIMEVLSAQARAGGAVLLALHDLSLAARFCNRLVLLDKGRVSATGTPAQVLTPDKLREVYRIEARVECYAEGVVILPQRRHGSLSE